MTAPAAPQAVVPPVPPVRPGEVQVAVTTEGRGKARLVVATTDLRSAWIEVRPSAALGAPAERSEITLDALVGALLDRLPETAAEPSSPDEVTVPAELAVALAGALERGDAQVVDAVAADQGWAGGVPPVLVELARSLLGSAQAVVRSATAEPLRYASLLLVPSGWVELERRGDLVVHRRVGRAELAQLFLSAISAHADAVLAAASAGADTASDDGPPSKGGGLTVEGGAGSDE